MWADLSFRGLSLKTRLILSYLLILAIGGLATSMVGSWIVSATIRKQVLRAADSSLAMAELIYEQRLDDLRQAVDLTASGATITGYLSSGEPRALLAYLERVRTSAGCDFLSLIDRNGRVIARVSNPARVGTLVEDSSSVVQAARAGKVAAATEILPAAFLAGENPALAQRALTVFVNTPRTTPFERKEETSGMALMAAAPVFGTAGVLYGGILLNGNFAIVDRVANLVLRDEGRAIGNVTIFQNNFRISTNVTMDDGRRALGTRAAPHVESQVLGRGEPWHGSTFVVNAGYLSRYAPIRDYNGKVIGAIFSGILESTYTSTRNQMIFSFFAVAIVGFICIIGITYYMIRNLTSPIGEMVAATESIAAGHLDAEVRTSAHGELAQLAGSFNTMLASLREMKADLEEWGRTLEEKVRERSEELVTMQARVAQSERLASLGLLAAGVAHEINNPLGAILALTALTLEDVLPDDPNRENLVEVVNQSQRCREIVKGLLDFSRQSKGRQQLLDLNALLKDTLSLIGKQSQFFNINLLKDFDPDLPSITGDFSQLQQVFMNLLMNAVQAMDERGCITIETRSLAEPYVEVAISDTGHGIAPDQVDKIFDPFFTTKASGQGTGLGLSIAYGIITTHRGTITVDSVVERGTRFTLRFPVAAPTEAGGRV